MKIRMLKALQVGELILEEGRCYAVPQDVADVLISRGAARHARYFERHVDLKDLQWSKA